MKEYKLQIIKEEDIIVISSDVIELLLQKIKSSAIRKIKIPAESIMPQGYIRYMANVLNSNRDKNKFRFPGITEEILGEKQIYQIVEQQMRNLRVEKAKCFDKFLLFQGNNQCVYVLSVNRIFLDICKASGSRFKYIYSDGREVSILL